MKYCNIEVPMCNRQNGAFRFFIKGIVNLLPIADMVDISINFNGQITNEEMVMVTEHIKKLGFDVYTKYNHYNFEKGKRSILKIREDTHRINETPYTCILNMDDDIEVIDKSYNKDVLAGIYMMLLHDDIGVITIDNRAKTEENKVIPKNMKAKTFTSGGLLLRNIPEWGGLVPEEVRNLHGFCADVLLGYERIKAGYKLYSIQSVGYEHEIHRRNGYLRGYKYHRWCESLGRDGSIHVYLESNGVNHATDFPDTLWKGEPYWNDPNAVFDYSNLSINQLKFMIRNLNKQ